MELVLLGLVAILGMAAIVLWMRANALDKELNYVRRRSQDQIFELGGMVNDLSSEVKKLTIQVRPLAGSLRFRPDLRMDELIEVHEAAPEVLAGFHIGGCDSCAVDPDSTLLDVAKEKNMPVETLVGALNDLIDGTTTNRHVAVSGLLQIQSSR